MRSCWCIRTILHCRSQWPYSTAVSYRQSPTCWLTNSSLPQSSISLCNHSYYLSRHMLHLDSWPHKVVTPSSPLLPLWPLLSLSNLFLYSSPSSSYIFSAFLFSPASLAHSRSVPCIIQLRQVRPLANNDINHLGYKRANVCSIL